jgi:hypothetical protein
MRAYSFFASCHEGVSRTVGHQFGRQKHANSLSCLTSRDDAELREEVERSWPVPCAACPAGRNVTSFALSLSVLDLPLPLNPVPCSSPLCFISSCLPLSSLFSFFSPFSFFPIFSFSPISSFSPLSSFSPVSSFSPISSFLLPPVFIIFPPSP